MILGVGVDLIDIRRIERTLARFGERFVERVFTAAEQTRAERRSDRAAAYAKRYAAKEACAKALGTGFRQGVYWRDIGVDNRPSGQPLLRLTGGAARASRGAHALRHDGADRPQPHRRAAVRPGGGDHQRDSRRRPRAGRRDRPALRLYVIRRLGLVSAHAREPVPLPAISKAAQALRRAGSARPLPCVS